VIDEDFLTGVSGLTVQFKDGTTTVGTVSVTSTGYFAQGVSPAATRFHLATSPFPFGYYKQYTYNTKRYTVLQTTCTAPLPALSAGVGSSLVDSIRLPNTSGPPPPPPNGCN
jgi:hypothetical protein